MKSEMEDLQFNLLCLRIIAGIFVVVLGFTILLNPVSASINDIKITVCNSINLTEPGCTSWWNGLNLTDLNFTEIVVKYNVITNVDEHNYDYSNVTKVYYNRTYNLSNYATKSYVTTKLNPYAKKSEINATQIINNTIIETKQSGFTWWNAGTLINFVLILGLIIFLFFMVRELKNMEWGE